MENDKIKAVTFESAIHLVQAGAVTGVIIHALGGGKWAIGFRGRQEYMLRSERENPRRFARVETALAEVKKLGLRRAEIDFVHWDPKQKGIA